MPDAPQALSPEDFYLDGPYLVFTAAYHQKRGYCCGSGCRHCPYRDADAPPTSTTKPDTSAATMDETGET